MTTSRMRANRGEELDEFAFGVGGALATREIQVVALKTLTKEEILISIRRVKLALLQRDIPRV